MDDVRLLFVITTALEATENLIKRRDNDPNWVFGVMITIEEIEEAKKHISEKFAAGREIFSAGALEKTAAYALGVFEKLHEEKVDDSGSSETAAGAIRMLAAELFETID